MFLLKFHDCCWMRKRRCMLMLIWLKFEFRMIVVAWYWFSLKCDNGTNRKIGSIMWLVNANHVHQMFVLIKMRFITQKCVWLSRWYTVGTTIATNIMYAFQDAFAYNLFTFSWKKNEKWNFSHQTKLCKMTNTKTFLTDDH